MRTLSIRYFNTGEKLDKLIIFDCDGTLVDSEVVATKFFTNYWKRFGVDFTELEFKEQFIGTGKNAPIVRETNQRLPKEAIEEGDRLKGQKPDFFCEDVYALKEELIKFAK